MSTHDRFSKLILVAPILFIAHWWEEAPGFVEWLNAHVTRGITNEMFTQVNATALVITVILSAIAFFDASAGSATAAIAWLAFLMAANAALHIAAAIVDRGYAPGVITAALLYVPYFLMMFVLARRRGASVAVLFVVSAIAATPMLIHGYLILFRGSRLF